MPFRLRWPLVLVFVASLACVDAPVLPSSSARALTQASASHETQTSEKPERPPLPHTRAHDEARSRHDSEASLRRQADKRATHAKEPSLRPFLLQLQRQASSLGRAYKRYHVATP